MMMSAVPKDKSFWTLTLNEIERENGRNLGSMNMDDFLTHLLNINNLDDENRQVQQPQLPHYNIYNNNSGYDLQLPRRPLMAGAPPLLQQQQPCFHIPSPFCKKTVGDVWFEIQREQNPANNVAVVPPPERQQSLGEMTLEDFLVLAGVVRKKAELQPTLDQVQIETVPSTPLEEVMIPVENVAPKARCFAVERRHRRMIKNRESAARSRARRQAYTLELELELDSLKEENIRLRQTLEAEENSKEKVVKMKKEGPEPKKADKVEGIRRTTSMSW